MKHTRRTRKHTVTKWERECDGRTTAPGSARDLMLQRAGEKDAGWLAKNKTQLIVVMDAVREQISNDCME